MKIITMTSGNYISTDEWNNITESERSAICSLIHEEQKKNLPDLKVNFKETFYTKYGKRILDLLIGTPAFLVFLPVNIILGVITWFDVGSPILFSQARVGKNGKVFKLYKFRNMTNETNEKGILLPPEKRITKWGKFARRTSLDELLNFWSVVKGEMSIIGPRPLPQKYTNRFSAYHWQRHLVRPGLECPFHDDTIMVNGWKERLDNDIWYVENVSFLTDVRMFFLLIKKVFSKDERMVSASGQQGEFIGYDEHAQIITEVNIPRKYLELIKAGDRIQHEPCK